MLKPVDEVKLSAAFFQVTTEYILTETGASFQLKKLPGQTRPAMNPHIDLDDGNQYAGEIRGTPCDFIQPAPALRCLTYAKGRSRAHCNQS